jgi:hypothetical protein
MCDITKRIDQYSVTVKNYDRISNLIELYNPTLSKILPSFYDVLWNDNLELKSIKDSKNIHPYYYDGHPSILEHYEYLEKTFNYNFSRKTTKTVNKIHNKCIDIIKNAYNNSKVNKITNISELPSEFLYHLFKECKIKNSNQFPSSIIF